MEGAAIGAVGALFELSALDSAVIGVAQRANEIMSARRFGGILGPRKRPNNDVGGPVKAVVSGGIGHYLGDFKKRMTNVNETLVQKYGYKCEQEIYGDLSMNDVQYLTVQSVNINMIARSIAAALARMIMWKHFKQTYVSEGDQLFPIVQQSDTTPPQLQQVYITTRWKYSDGTDNSAGTPVFNPAITSNTTLNDMINGIVPIIISTTSPAMYDGDFRQFTGYQFVYRADNSGGTTVTRSVSPRWPIDNQEISLSVVQVINLQNVTRGTYFIDGGANFARGFRDEIGANPIVGRVFHLKGIYPDVEYQSGSDTVNVGTFPKLLQKFVNPPHAVGIGVPDANPTGSWRSIPEPQMFANILSCGSGLRLEPGDIKKEVLRFDYSGRLNDLIKGLSYLGTTPTAGNESQPIYSQGKMGTCKLFAFEKVVPTGFDAVELAYHIDRYINAVCPPSWQTLSVRGEFSSTKFDLKLGTTVLAAQQAEAPVRDPDGVDVDVADG